MAGESLTAADAEEGVWARTPAAVRVAVVYLAARVVTTVFLVVAGVVLMMIFSLAEEEH